MVVFLVLCQVEIEITGFTASYIVYVFVYLTGLLL
jgi:hypothetical protein